MEDMKEVSHSELVSLIRNGGDEQIMARIDESEYCCNPSEDLREELAAAAERKAEEIDAPDEAEQRQEGDQVAADTVAAQDAAAGAGGDDNPNPGSGPGGDGDDSPPGGDTDGDGQPNPPAA